MEFRSKPSFSLLRGLTVRASLARGGGSFDEIDLERGDVIAWVVPEFHIQASHYSFDRGLDWHRGQKKVDRPAARMRTIGVRQFLHGWSSH